MKWNGKFGFLFSDNHRKCRRCGCIVKYDYNVNDTKMVELDGSVHFCPDIRSGDRRIRERRRR